MKEKNEEEKYSEENRERGSTAHENDAHFDLADKSKGFVNLDLNDENLSYTGNFLQKLHLRNHSRASKETIHEVYRQEEEISGSESGSFSQDDELIFSEVQNAIAEHDITSLRNNLQFISRNIPAHQYGFKDIEEYIDGELDEEIRMSMAEEALSNLNLAEDIRLSEEINQAVIEKDILQLRAHLIEICENVSSHNRSVEEIDRYLSNGFEEADREDFEMEMFHNPDLAKDVEMHYEIEEAIQEKDVISLRENLNRIKDAENDEDSYQKRGLIALKKQKIMWYAAAASIVLMIGFNFAIRNQKLSNGELYQEYFQPFDTNIGVTRSGSASEETIIDKALISMNQKDYDSAISLFSSVLKEDPDNAVCNFYTGTIRQTTGDYDAAIHSFANVIRQGDNLFLEQSEWFVGLCYLKRNQKELAIQQFKKIIEKKGYFKKKSEEILAKLE